MSQRGREAQSQIIAEFLYSKRNFRFKPGGFVWVQWAIIYMDSGWTTRTWTATGLIWIITELITMTLLNCYHLYCVFPSFLFFALTQNFFHLRWVEYSNFFKSKVHASKELSRAFTFCGWAQCLVLFYKPGKFVLPRDSDV